MESPGQLLKHYAPYLPCYYTSSEQIKQSRNNNLKIEESGGNIELNKVALLVLDEEENERDGFGLFSDIVKG